MLQFPIRSVIEVFHADVKTVGVVIATGSGEDPEHSTDELTVELIAGIEGFPAGTKLVFVDGKSIDGFRLGDMVDDHTTFTEPDNSAINVTVSRIQNPFIRRATIIATLPFVLVGNVLLTVGGIAVIAVVTLAKIPGTIFKSVKEVW